MGVRGEAYLLQWLLPVFAADFPISLSLRVLDLLALGGMKRLLQAALALLEAIQGTALLLLRLLLLLSMQPSSQALTLPNCSSQPIQC